MYYHKVAVAVQVAICIIQQRQNDKPHLNFKPLQGLEKKKKNELRIFDAR